MFESGNETSFASFAMASYKGPTYCIRWNRGRICKEQGELDGEGELGGEGELDGEGEIDGEERVKYLKNHNK